MNSKYGFNDGGSVPPDVYECREVYIKVLNKLLEKNSSDFRIKELDRNGVHNPYLWIRVEKDNLGNDEETESPTDKAWDDAVSEAYCLGLDDFVETELSMV